MLVNFCFINILQKIEENITLFVATNFAELSKKLDIVLKPFSALCLLSSLGALGRRFTSFLPDLLFSDRKKLLQENLGEMTPSRRGFSHSFLQEFKEFNFCFKYF